MYTVDFTKLTDLPSLAQVLGCSSADLERMRNHAGRHYVRHEIKKRSGHGKRIVWEIDDSQFKATLQSLAKRLFDYGAARVEGFPHPACHGYTPGRSILTNASEHVGTKFLLKSDIHEFFPSITRSRLLRLFADLGFKTEIADILSDLCAHNGSLPLGSPSSPVIANLVTLGLDNDLTQLAVDFECKYTRYSDDLTFSSNDAVPPQIALRSIVQGQGFDIVPRKTQFKKRGHAHYVTGLSVSTNHHPRAPRRLKKRLRQEMYFIERYGLEAHLGLSNYPTFQSGINQIDGTLRWLRGIEPWFAAPMQKRWEFALQVAGMSVTYTPRFDRAPRDVVLLVDESEVCLNGQQHLVVGVVVLEDIDHIRARLEALRTKWLSDAFYTGDKAPLQKKGIHWSEIPEGSREELVREIAELPFRAYAALKPTKDRSYSDDYIFLLRELLKGRFTGLDGCNLIVAFEENSKVGYAKVKDTVGQLYNESMASDARRPRRPPGVDRVSKSTERALPVVDGMLGALCRYLSIEVSNPSPVKHGVMVTAFERVRMKFRLIIAYDESFGSRRAFSRWKPIEPAVGWMEQR